MRRAVPLVVSTVLGLVALAGCGENRYRYVSNSTEGAFFKIPSDWELFDLEAEAASDPETSRPAPVETGQEAEAWSVAFDSAPEPAIEHLDEMAPDHVVGIVQVRPLSFQQRDELSFKSMRAGLFGGQDPLELASSGDPDVEVVDFTPVVTDTVNGDRVVVNVRNDDGVWVTFDQSVFTNADSSKIYRLVVVCEASCYEQNRSTIDAVVSSWQVNE